MMRTVRVLDELSRATRNEVRLGVLRGSDVLALHALSQPITERVHAEALLHAVIPGHAAAAGKHSWPSPQQGSSTRSSRPGCPRSTAHHHLTRRAAPKAFADQLDAGRDIAQRIRVRHSGDRDADLLRRGRVAAAIELT
jgi:hypothetical protein